MKRGHMETIPSWWAKLQLIGLSATCVSLIALRSLVNRQRMSHQNGIVARGRVRIVDDLAIPDTDFFTARRHPDGAGVHAVRRCSAQVHRRARSQSDAGDGEPDQLQDVPA